jgi:3-keto-disaccharide hydrolase
MSKSVVNAAACAGVLLFSSLAYSQAEQTVSVAPDSPRWELEGDAKVVEYQGRKSLRMDGAAAVLKDFEMRDGVIDVDVNTPAKRGFVGFDFRVDKDQANYEEVYFRQHQSGQADALQYTPVLGTGRNWQLFNGPGFTDAVDIPKNEWFHLRLVVAGAQAKLYLKDMEKPALVMDDLKSGIQKGQIALNDLTGETYFSNFQVRTTPDAPWERHLPAMPPNTITKWSISPAYDALARDLEKPLTLAEIAEIKWQEVEAEPPGFVVLYRYRQAPHPRVTFQGDFSKRLEPQPGMKMLYARTTIDSDRDQVKKLEIGYSDDVSVFLNGQILWRGRSAQGFRDPRFLGIVNPENDAVYLPLKKGSNDLTLAVSELGGGWGFICRLYDAK